MPAPKREQIHKENLLEIIRKYAYTYGYNYAQVAKLSGFSERTFYNRIKDPGKLTLDEINRIARAIKIPAAELSPILAWGWIR
ncbi:MAG: hypothetical protein PUF80_00585 [Firmicutes bacterium]|nr:hypothetical protein [Bacillota bacterium]